MFTIIRTLLNYTLFTLALILFSFLEASSTHIRAGDITMRRVGNNVLQYEISVYLYRDTEGIPAPNGEINFGTGDSVIVSPDDLGKINEGTTEILLYQTVYTFPSSGWYNVSFSQGNRNEGILNMDNSVGTNFFIESKFWINPLLGLNSSPALLIPPIDEAVVGQRYIHNPGAFDAQGDSMAYHLIRSKQARNFEVDNYRFPHDPNENWTQETEDGVRPGLFYMDEITGDLVWDAPSIPGEYNVAFIVEEFRDGTLIGVVNRDMQIIVVESDNERPELLIPNDTCIVVGETLIDTIAGIDPDEDFIKLSLETIIPPNEEPIFESLNLQPPNGYEEGQFTWTPSCESVRERPYEFTFKVKDRPTDNASLVDLKTWRVRVVAPSPEGLNLELNEDLAQVTLTWSDYTCANAQSMRIYRKKGSFDFDPICETGIPAYTGYQMVGEVPIGETTFIDDNLERGTNYCYRIYAVFPNPKGGESLSSSEVCVFVPDLFYMTNVSVDETSTSDGEITVRWTTPDPALSSTYSSLSFDLYRTQENDLENTVLVKENASETDTTFQDLGLNTTNEKYFYQVILKGDGKEITQSYLSSQVRLEATPKQQSIELNWEADVPWNITSEYKHYIYRKKEAEEDETYVLIDSVATATNGLQYIDYGQAPFILEELVKYKYKVKTLGSYGVTHIREPLENWSQEVVAELLDIIPPCPPILSLDKLNCDVLAQLSMNMQFGECPSENYTNKLRWVDNTDESCTELPSSYNIYFSPRIANEKGAFTLIASTDDHHFYDTDLFSAAGCYAVTAVDLSGNESDFSNIECQDNCPYIEFPNAFSPNGDGINDTFTPMKCPRFVESITFSVFNRWGQIIYEGNENPQIHWEGHDNNGNAVSPGVYFYEARVRFFRLEEKHELDIYKGWIQILSEEIRQTP